MNKPSKNQVALRRFAVQAMNYGVVLDHTDMKSMVSLFGYNKNYKIDKLRNTLLSARAKQEGANVATAKYGKYGLLYDDSLPLEQVDFDASLKALQNWSSEHEPGMLDQPQLIISGDEPPIVYELTPEEMRVPSLRVGMWACHFA
jgi:hypothetical protein